MADVSDAPGAQANGVALQPDGKIVVAGASPLVSDVDFKKKGHFALARFDSDGSLDTSFGLSGKVFTAIGTNDVAYAVAIQPDGKIVAAGSSLILSNNEFAVARYFPSGARDQLFGTGGAATALVGTNADQVRAIQIQPDGKIVVAGIATDSTGTNHFALARFTTNGALDANFGSGGKLTTPFATGSVDGAYGMGIRPDGKISAAGFTGQTSGGSLTSANMAAARYNTNGAPDLTFGSFGRASANVGGGTLDVGYAMAIQPDGKIIVAGGAGIAGSFRSGRQQCAGGRRRGPWRASLPTACLDNSFWQRRNSYQPGGSGERFRNVARPAKRWKNPRGRREPERQLPIFYAALQFRRLDRWLVSETAALRW